MAFQALERGQQDKEMMAVIMAEQPAQDLDVRAAAELAKLDKETHPKVEMHLAELE
jgi:hypothetical protein